MHDISKLTDFLGRLHADQWRPTFHEIELLVGSELPSDAKKDASWWANKRDGHSEAWTSAGWETADVDVEAGRLRFVKAAPTGAADSGAASARSTARRAEAAPARSNERPGLGLVGFIVLAAGAFIAYRVARAAVSAGTAAGASVADVTLTAASRAAAKTRAAGERLRHLA